MVEENEGVPSRTAAERHADAVFNRRLDQMTNGLHALAIATAIGGFVRAFVDPSVEPGVARLLLTMLFALAIELVSLYLIGWRRMEDKE